MYTYIYIHVVKIIIVIQYFYHYYCRMNIMNLNKQMRLYQQGLTPMMKTLPGRGGWERLRGRPVYQVRLATLSYVVDTPPHM